MRLKVFHSIPEALSYGLIVLLLVFNILLLTATSRDTQQIEHQQTCLVSLFFNPDRAQLTLADVSGCSKVSINN